MEGYMEEMAGAGRNGMLKPDSQEAKRLRNQLMEYDGYLQEMRKSNMKNVETLDVIQRYTDKSAAGIQNLTEESASGMQKLAEESLQGISQLAQECTGSLRKYASAGEEALEQIREEGVAQFSRLTQESLERIEEVTEEGLSRIHALAEESLSRIQEVNNRNIETAQRVDEIRELVAGQTESLRAMREAADDFTHKENVKVYRNVQAVVVEEVKKQTEELTAQMKAAEKGTRPLLIATLVFAVANAALFILQILGILGI